MSLVILDTLTGEREFIVGANLANVDAAAAFGHTTPAHMVGEIVAAWAEKREVEIESGEYGRRIVEAQMALDHDDEEVNP